MPWFKRSYQIVIACTLTAVYGVILFTIIPELWRSPLVVVPVTAVWLILLVRNINRKAWKKLGLVRQVLSIIAMLYFPFYNAYSIVWTALYASDAPYLSWGLRGSPVFNLLYAGCMLAVIFLLPWEARANTLGGQPC